ncbi:MFS transporter [Terribacillus saccharophilus]|uniref:MFS transporter n=1 Tax=Terribacillus saccharophilus TaxID=361277 RepID=UPI00117D6A34|nr:MFS transporter [Terribacillus saccharophilus]
MLLLQNHNYRMLLVSSIFSSFSISMYLLIEQWYVVNELNVPKLVGAVLLATTLPRVIFMFVGGMLADRLRNSRIIFFSLLSRSILMLLAALLFRGEFASSSATTLFCCYIWDIRCFFLARS